MITDRDPGDEHVTATKTDTKACRICGKRDLPTSGVHFAHVSHVKPCPGSWPPSGAKKPSSEAP